MTEALERAGELSPVAEIRIEASGKYWRVTGFRLGGDAVDEVVPDEPAGNLRMLGGFR